MMDSTFDKLAEGLMAIVLSPVILPIASAIKQPMVQNTIKDGIILSENVKNSVLEISETWEKLITEVRKDKSDSFSYIDYPNHQINSKSAVARELINIVSDLNNDVGVMTNGVIDIKVIFPLIIAGFALEQLLKKGLQLEEIPWYILAWFAFDIFTRLNFEDESELKDLSINAVSVEFQEQYSNR